VADDPHSPVVIRVTRPYASESELLDIELDTLTRTSITLLGAQPRPPGLVLRFELLLSSGQLLLRGEGRVIGYRPDAHNGMGGLSLRFTRLDLRSKELVERAAALRERRRPPTGPFAEAPSLNAPPIPLEDPIEDVPVQTPSTPELWQQAAAPLPTEPDARQEPRGPSAPHDRDALLDRLRARSKAMDADAVRKILERRRG
jgi:hypothetical protein